jgi:hypothetical protein
MLSVIYAEYHIYTFYAECRYADCRNADCRYAECSYAECRSAVSSQPLESLFHSGLNFSSNVQANCPRQMLDPPQKSWTGQTL